MTRISLGTVVRLFILCLIVGMVLAWLGLEPDNVWQTLGALARRAAAGTLAFLEWAWPYLVMGAAVVLPLYCLRLVWRRRRRR